MNVAICVSPNNKEHSTSWSKPWKEYCDQNNIAIQTINPYSSDIISQLHKFDVLLWHYSGYNYTDMLIAKNIIYSAKQIGLSVFPDFNDCWHFDDKVSQTYLLQSINAPIPKSYMFYTEQALESYISNSPSFPVIAKLRNGSGSHNVKMLQSKADLLQYSKTMFSSGFSSSPSLLYKASSNILSSDSLKKVLIRAKRIPEFLRTRASAQNFANEKGYIYLQEFIPNENFDLKVVVVGDKLSFIGRNIRKGEFRASGGGDLFFDSSLISKNIIESAFNTSDSLGFKCMGYDYVVNKNNGKGIIIEMSYGFSHQALIQAGGYFNREGRWFDEPLNAPKELLKNILA